ncbi:MAG: FAD:protein FMN transferase [Bacteroidota bacterium]
MKNIVILSFAILLFGCDSRERWVKNQAVGEALGTTYGLTFIAREKIDAQQKIDSVFRVINASLSTYIPDSDISKINRGDSTIVVDKSFRDVYLQSQRVYVETKGYFDPTVGVLVNAWGFGPEKPINQLDSVQVDSLMQYVGWSKVQLKSDFTISKANPNIRFDFNAIAKGYAIDRLAQMLDDSFGVDHYLVEVGGEVVAKGINVITGKPWTIGIDDPTNLDSRGSAALIHLKDGALASSGNYRKFRVDEATGEKYVHTINAKTGFTKNSNILSATVVANNCMEADAYATAFMAMELEDTQNLLKQVNDLETFIIYLDEQGNTQRFMTPGFEKLLVQ